MKDVLEVPNININMYSKKEHFAYLLVKILKLLFLKMLKLKKIQIIFVKIQILKVALP